MSKIRFLKSSKKIFFMVKSVLLAAFTHVKAIFLKATK